MAVTVYILTLIPAMLFALVMMVLSAPRVVATAYDSLGVLGGKFSSALDDGKGVNVAASALQMVALCLPIAGMTATAGRLGRRVGGGAWRWSEGDAVRRGGLGVLLTAGLALAAFTWWPNGEYRPIQPGERGTVSSGVDAISAIPTGRPALTPTRAAELDGAPTVRDNGGDFRDFKLDDRKDAGEAREKEKPETSTTPEATTTTPPPEPIEPAPAPTEEPVPAEPAPVPEPEPTQPIDPTTEPTP